MFWLLVRALLLVAIGGFFALIAMAAGGPFIDVLQTHQTGGSRNAYWAEQTLTWLPGIILGGIILMVLGGAAAQRGWR